MSSIGSIEKMHYIVDGCGHYYRINGKDQLVAANSREDAGVFSFLEADQRIGSGKRAQFYSMVPVEESGEIFAEDANRFGDTDTAVTEAGEPGTGFVSGEESGSRITEPVSGAGQSSSTAEQDSGTAEQDSDMAEQGSGAGQNSGTAGQNSRMILPEGSAADEEDEKLSLPYDIRRMDWKEYLIHFCYISAGIHDYLDDLNRTLSDIDLQICDLMHYIELYDLDEEGSVRMAVLLKECREQRRDVKDEMEQVECFQRTIGNSGNIARAREGLKQMKKLAARTYHPRKLKELFQNSPRKTNRDNKLLRAFTYVSCLDVEHVYETVDIEQNMEEEGGYMEYTRQTTVFDGKETDWMQFAKQQAEFYANAEQYMYNLQADLDEIEEELEQTLCEVEDANYNVAQGYNVFKRLKELRNAKKAKLKELDCLNILTERFDCGMMADIMEDCIVELEDVFEEPEKEEKEGKEEEEMAE